MELEIKNYNDLGQWGTHNINKLLEPYIISRIEEENTLKIIFTDHLTIQELDNILINVLNEIELC